MDSVICFRNYPEESGSSEILAVKKKQNSTFSRNESEIGSLSNRNLDWRLPTAEFLPARKVLPPPRVYMLH